MTDILATAREIRQRVRDLEIRPVYHHTGYETPSQYFIDAMNELTEAEASGKDEPALKMIALKIVKNYEILASNNKIEETAKVTSYMKWYKEDSEKLEKEKAQLKKDNEELLGKLLKAEAKFEYVSELHEKLMGKLADSYKKAMEK